VVEQLKQRVALRRANNGIAEDKNTLLREELADGEKKFQKKEEYYRSLLTEISRAEGRRSLQT